MVRSRSAVAFSPCQITGFFTIHDKYVDTARVGSKGAGVCIEQGVTTKVTVKREEKGSIFLLNGRPLLRPVVSRIVLAKFREMVGPFRARINHSTPLPVGCGYGTSGAGALSLSLALNEALNSPLTALDSARVAHTAEIEAKTGLGTVASEFAGGVVVRLKPGAPGVGLTKRLKFGRRLRVVSASFGPFRKSRVLGNVRLSDRVNLCGRNLVRLLMARPKEDRFMQLSRTFSSCLGLTTPRLDETIKRLEAQGLFPSMMMLGESLFCLVDRDLTRSTSRLLRMSGLKPIISEISYRGARLI